MLGVGHIVRHGFGWPSTLQDELQAQHTGTACAMRWFADGRVHLAIKTGEALPLAWRWDSTSPPDVRRPSVSAFPRSACAHSLSPSVGRQCGVSPSQSGSAYAVEQWMGDTAHDLASNGSEWAKRRGGYIAWCTATFKPRAQLRTRAQGRPSEAVACRPRHLRALPRRRRKTTATSEANSRTFGRSRPVWARRRAIPGEMDQIRIEFEQAQGD